MKSILLLACAIAQSAHAQNLEIGWFALSGGGGTSVGGQFAVSGAVLQPVTGISASEPLVITSGFWGFPFDEHLTDSPALSIAQELDGSIRITWPRSNFALEVSPDLSAPNWTRVATAPEQTATTSSVILPNRNDVQFYRLRRP